MPPAPPMNISSASLRVGRGNAGVSRRSCSSAQAEHSSTAVALAEKGKDDRVGALRKTSRPIFQLEKASVMERRARWASAIAEDARACSRG